MGNAVFGLIYTGESSMQLRDLTYSRSVAAVPFAGRYRCIDFIMSNLVNTGISNVGIIAQKNYHSLIIWAPAWNGSCTGSGTACSYWLPS